ncbi:lysozyme [Apibacter muscae]|uniref:lysozyme n=1 Tax=Apibacter muscae TaxID=2509004 RepID=UPI001624BA9D|nr:lysozyme [Apibacter muscae]
MEDKYFTKTESGLDGKDIVILAKELGYTNTCNCLGIINVQNKNENKTQDKRVDPKTLKATEKIKEFIKSFEGYYAKPYDDTKGYATIGIGYLIDYKSYTKVTQADIAKTEITWKEFTNGISEKRALELMNKKITKYENSIYRDITVPLYQYEFDALISLLFNCGPDFLKDKITKAPKLRSNLINKKYEAAANEFLDITNSGTPGLVKRRKHENKIFLENIYENNK